jgi:carbonic anhydrase
MNEQGPFADVLRANEAYARDFRSDALDGRAARGLAVLTCIDSRIEPLAMLGLKPGDAKILRNAGARVTDDVLRTLMLASYLLGVERVMLIAHTKCRLTARNDEVRSAIREAGGPTIGPAPLLAAPDPAAALHADVQHLHASPFLPQLHVGGFLYDVDTGRLQQIV